MIRNSEGEYIILATLFWVFVCAATLAWGQVPKTSDANLNPQRFPSRPIRADVELVLVNVTVIDPASDRPITGLTRDNFEVFEDKKPQQVSQFSTEEVPLSVGVVFDLSGSMADKVDQSRMALHQFFRASNPHDEFFLVGFNDRPQKLASFTRDLQMLQNRINFTQAQGLTSLLDAVYLALSEMRKAPNPRKVLLIISDGGDNHSRYTPRDIRNAVKEADVQIYAIGIYEPLAYRGTLEELAGPSLLAEIAQMTGGREFAIQTADDLPAAAARIGHEMRNVYVLGYSPANPKHDGKWRKIQVKLRLPKGVPRLQLFSKSGYYAPH